MEAILFLLPTTPPPPPLSISGHPITAIHLLEFLLIITKPISFN
jgi:hypothetical protein